MGLQITLRGKFGDTSITLFKRIDASLNWTIVKHAISSNQTDPMVLKIEIQNNSIVAFVGTYENEVYRYQETSTRITELKTKKSQVSVFPIFSYHLTTLISSIIKKPKWNFIYPNTKRFNTKILII